MESKVAELPLSHRAWAWFEKNQKPALLGATAAVVLGVLIWGFIWWAGEKQVKASNALSDVATAQMGSSTAQPAETAPQAYLRVVAQYPHSKAGARALLLAAGALFTEGKYAEAQTQFERFTKDYHDSPLLGEALVGVASCLEAQGKVEQAATAYRDLISRHPTDSVVPQAKFSLGGIYEKQKRPELAREMYKQVEQESRMSILGSEAGLRLEEMAQNNPNLPAALGNTPTPLPTVKVPAPTGTNAPTSTNPPVQVTNK